MTTARTAICLDCRTALEPGARCDVAGNHRVKRLDLPDQRSSIVDEVWGPPHLRGRKLAKVGSGGGAAGGLFEGCAGLDGCSSAGTAGELGAIIVVVVIAAFAAIALWWIISRIVHAVRERRARTRPRGVEIRAAPSRWLLRGRIGTTHGDTAPLTGDACAGWAIRLRHSDAVGGDLMFRDGQTAGFTIELDDGRRVQVPAGRLYLDGKGRTVDDPAPHLRRVDPAYDAADPHGPIPCDRAEELLVQPGDAIELASPVEERPDPQAAPAGYRAAAPSLLVPVGIPSLRVG